MNEKITAYVLNEMPPAERADFEAQLQTDPTLRSQVEEMQMFCSLLHDNVSKSDTTNEAEAFTEEQRQSVISAFDQENKVIHVPFWRHPFLLSSTAVAACLTVLLLVNLDVVEQSQSVVSHYEGHVETESDSETKSKKSKVGYDLGSDAPAPPSPPSMPTTAPEEPRKKENRANAQLGGTVSVPDESSASAPAPKPKSTVAPQPMIAAAPVTTLPPAPTLMDGATLESKVTESMSGEMTRERFGRDSDDELGGGVQVDYFADHRMPEIDGRQLSLPATSTPQSKTDGTSNDHLNGHLLSELNRLKENSAPLTSETYTQIVENTFKSVTSEPLSTFSIDVDTASYANVRRYLNDGLRPPVDAVRLEELINYFPYSYEPPSDNKPFSVTVDIAEAPWQPLHRLARVAIKGRELNGERGPANFVFLVDVSGSMDSRDKLPLVIQSLRMLVDQLRADDRVAIVTYAGESSVVLESTPGSQKEKIIAKIDGLNAGGSTHGSSGIRMAYEQAAANFQKDGVNRVILCTDGDFNVGVSSPEELEKLITEKAKTKVFLSVLGYGTGNVKDRTMETLADKGNGNYAYIDSVSEARKVLVDQMSGTLVTIAKDVKIQVEFNPAQVASYRLIGYENRTMAKEDFNDDKKDAGEIGAGHTVTALYEIIPAGLKHPDGRPVVDDLKYTRTTPTPAPKPTEPTTAAATAEMMTVKLRYKAPEGDVSSLIEVPVTDAGHKLSEAPQDFQFITSVAGFGMLLRKSPNAGEITWDTVRELALKGKGNDPLGYRGEFLQLIEKARGLQ